ncbi:MAG: ferrous iron transport protein A [Ignavibacteriales bacterium]
MVTRLVYCNNDEKVTIEDVAAGNGAVENLKELGIYLKDEISISENIESKGPIKINKNDRKILIGRKLAEKILVNSISEQILPLSKIKIGDKVEVVKMNSDGEIRYRLLDMGLIKGVKLKIIRVAPLGDPIEVEMSGFNLTLRLNEAESILVKPVEIEKNKRKKFSLFS